jgi:hypothetical protein
VKCKTLLYVEHNCFLLYARLARLAYNKKQLCSTYDSVLYFIGTLVAHRDAIRHTVMGVFFNLGDGNDWLSRNVGALLPIYSE